VRAATIMLALSFGVFATTAKPAQITPWQFEGKWVLSIQGPIEEGDYERVVKYDLSRFTVVQLNSPGGLVAPALDIAAAVQKAGVSTVVGNGDICASACFIIFACGTYKTAHPNARISIHASRPQDGEENSASYAADTLLARSLSK
jgi:hypothetical protein